MRSFCRFFEGLLRLIILDALVRVDKEFPIGHGLIEGSLHFRNGSKLPVHEGGQLRPESGVMRTKIGAKPTSAIECPKLAPFRPW